jgi:hypothetical protein
MSPYPSTAVSDGLLSPGITTSYFLTSHPTFLSYAHSTVSTTGAPKSKRLNIAIHLPLKNIYFFKCINLCMEMWSGRQGDIVQSWSIQQNLG